jgi:hypothetical protein
MTTDEQIIETNPQTQCPRCLAWVDDLDGFGVLAHLGPDGCGYCSHPSTVILVGPTDTGLMRERCDVCRGTVESRTINGRYEVLRVIPNPRPDVDAQLARSKALRERLGAKYDLDPEAK